MSRRAWLITLVGLGVALWVVGLALVLGADGDGDGGGSALPGTIPGEITPVPDDAPAFARPFLQVRAALGEECFDLLLADTPERRTQGLRGVADPSPWAGMLFAHPEPATTGFTMAGVPTGLTIGWYDATGRRLGTAEMAACDGDDVSCPSYVPPAPWIYAVEFPLGTLPPGALGSC